MDLTRPPPRKRPNFSLIARRLLLERQQSTPSGLSVLFQPANETKPPNERSVVVLSQNASDNKPPSEESTSFHTTELLDCEPPPEQAFELMDDHFNDYRPVDEPVLLPVSVLKVQIPQPPEMRVDLGPFPSPPLKRKLLDAEYEGPELLCKRIRELTPEKLTKPLKNALVPVPNPGPNPFAVELPTIGKRARIVIRRVRVFFEEFKRLLGDSCEGTIFESPVEMTAMACGVTTEIVKKMGVRSDFVHELFPRREKKPFDPEALEESVLRIYGEKWGQIVKHFIRDRLKRESMTISALHAELRKAYADFKMSKSTLFRFAKALGVTFGRNRGIAYMLV